MGSGSKKVTVGYKYYMGALIGLAEGPLDKIFRIDVADKKAFVGNCTGGRISINKPSLFGGTDLEGGIIGDLDIEMGYPTQTPNDYLTGILGSLLPAFRGYCNAVLRKVYIGTNYYGKEWKFWGQRIHVTSDGAAQWYDEKAAVGDAYTTTDSTTTAQPARSRADIISVGSAWFHKIVDLSDVDTYFGVYDGAGIAPYADRLPHPYIVDEHFSNSDAFTTLETRKSYWFKKTIVIDDFRPLIIVVCADDDAALWVNEIGVALSSGGSYGVRVGTYTPTQLQNTIYVRVRDTGPDTTSNYVYFDAYVYQAATSASSVTVETAADYYDMNPAHILRECKTNATWGLGLPSAEMGSSWATAADTLYAENFGLSFLWTTTDLDEFMADVCRHVDAVMYEDHRTGLHEIKLIRNDYDINDLIVLDASNSEITELVEQALDDLINEVTVKYVDAYTGNEAAYTVQDIALAQLQGTPVPTTVSYPGIRNAQLAQRVAWRDLRTLGTSRLSCKVSAHRVAAQLHKGDPFILNHPRAGVNNVVMRVGSINLGSLTSTQVTLACTQDVFSTPHSLSTATPSSAWAAPDLSAQPTTYQIGFELPYLELVQRLGQDYVDQLLASRPESGLIGVAAASPTPISVNAELWTDSGAGYVEYSDGADWCPVATLSEGVGYLDQTWSIDAISDMDEVEVGKWAQIDDELVAVTSIDLSAGAMTVARAVLDTVPAEHAAGADIYFWDDWAATDSVEYVQSEEIRAKLLTRTPTGTLEIGYATTSVVTLQGRAARPYPPGNVYINDALFPEEITGPLVSLSWSHRDRLQQTAGLIGWTEGDIGPENGVTYSAALKILETGEVLASVDGISSTSGELSQDSFTGDVLLELWAVRAGLDSFRKFSHSFFHDSGIAFNDVYWSNVTFMLQAPDNAVDGSTFIRNRSMYGHTVTTNGNVRIDTSLGYPTILFDGTGDYLLTSYNSDLNISGACTIDAIVMATASKPFAVIMQTRPAGTTSHGWRLGTGALVPSIVFWTGATVSLELISDTPLVLNTLHHIRVAVDDDMNVTMAIDGVVVASGQATAWPSLYSYTPQIGRDATTTDRDWIGHIRSLRITQGVRREITESLTVLPTSYIDGDSYWKNVVLLTTPALDDEDGSTNITDKSTYGRALTVSGNAQVDTSLGYPTYLFDGNGDYIIAPDSDDLDFQNEGSIELIFVKTSLSKIEMVYGKRYYSDSPVTGYEFVFSTSGTLAFSWYSNGTYYAIVSESGSITVGIKYHAEVSVDAHGTVRFFLDGVLVGSGSLAVYPMSLNGRQLSIGRQQGNTTRDFSGHLTVRHTHGRSRHSSDDSFTPPESFVVGE